MTVKLKDARSDAVRAVRTMSAVYPVRLSSKRMVADLTMAEARQLAKDLAAALA